MPFLRPIALAALAVLAPAPPAHAQSGAPSGAFGATITIVEPFGLNSPSEMAIRALRPALERELGARLLIEHIGGDSGDVALARVNTAAPNGRTLLVITDASRIFHEYLARTARGLADLRPIAKLTDGISLALVTPPNSPLATWEQFAQRARDDPPTVAAFGRDSPSGIFLGMVERQVGRELPTRRLTLDLEVIAAMAEGAAGVLETSTALGQPGAGHKPMHVLLTSGARRHPGLPDTPTLAELTGNPRLAFTMAVGVFGPPKLGDEAAKALAHAFLAAGASDSARAAAQRLHLPLAVRDAAVLRATMERTARVIRELAGR